MAKRKEPLRSTGSQPHEFAEMKARRLGNRWIHERLPTDYTCGDPRPLRGSTWSVPILLAYPGVVVGQVGVLTLDLDTEQVVRHTPLERILATGDRLAANHAEAIQAAYLRARNG